MKKLVYIIISLFLMMQLSYGQVTKSFSLKQAQDYAVQNNATVKNAQIDIIKSEKKVWETTAMGLPQVSSSLSYQNMLEIPVTLIPAQIFDPDAPPDTYMEMKFGTQHNASFEITANQLVFSGPYIVGLQASKIYKKLSQQALDKAKVDIKETVTQTYFLALVAKENKSILQESYENLKKIFEETSKMLKAGFVEETDVDQLEYTLKNIEISLNTITNQIDLSQNLLKYQMGIDLKEEIILTDKLENIVETVGANALQVNVFNVNEHIDFQLMQTQEYLQKLNLKREKSEFLPSISAFYSYNQKAMRNDFDFFESEKDWFPSNIVGASLNIPIFSSGLKLSRVQQAKLELEKARNSKEMVSQGLILGVQQANSDFSTATEKYNNEKSNMKITKRIYDRTLIKFNQGMSSSLELTQVHNQYLNSQSNYFNAIFELLNAKNKLDKALNKYK